MRRAAVPGGHRATAARLAIAGGALLAAAPSAAGDDFLLGADVSMLPRLEAAGAVYRERGKPADALRMLRDRGANAFRVRLFVDPGDRDDGAIQDLPYALELARRVESAGAALVLDLHYSDTWADPGRQTKPATWEALDFAGLEARVESWTAETVAAFVAAGCAPEYVQIGNEITAGFLWPDGRIGPGGEGWDRFATLLKAGARGAKRAHADARILLHVDAGGDAERTARFFRRIEAHGVPFDLIGLSYYPWWHGAPAALAENLRSTAAEFGKDILLVETAYPGRADDASGPTPWPRTPDGQRAFLEDVVRIVRGSPRGLGVLWWGPETIPAAGVTAWKGGAAALFDAEGRPLPALEAFRELAPAPPDPVTVHVFHRQPVRFAPESAARFDTPEIRAADNGREIERTVLLPEPSYPVRIVARVRLHPIPKDAASVCDPWDRAGSVRLAAPGRPDVEVVKFITAYGGATTHELDVTNLAPLLRGACTFRGFVDTWLDPAWRMDFELVFEPADTEPTPEWMREWLEPGDRRAPDWVVPLAYETITRERMDAGDVTARVTVPPDAERIVLEYLVSGHCTDGRDADEFVAKDNVITVDGVEAHRFRPWRDDCRRFREVNPYCRRWFDGSWSADFSRSGWCPGDAVRPVPIDLTGRLPAGEHAIGIRVEDVRPEDDSGHGYWRVSARLVGWNRPPTSGGGTPRSRRRRGCRRPA